ncbi:MAG: branched-chain amino acid ABC transporter permease [Pseudolabrys sp.]
MNSRKLKILTVAIVLAALAYIIPHSSSFVVLLATRALVFAILAMSLDILLGFTGLASLGQAAYFSVGAYFTAIMATKFHFGLGWDFWLVVILGMAVAALLAAFFGLFAIRASGVYFLMITLALGQCVWGLAYRWNSLTGGDNGINVPTRPSFGLDLTDERTFFFLVFGFFVATLIVLYVLVQSPFGRSLTGIRERELRMQILGYNTWLHKYIAFIIAGAFGGLAGVLWTHTNGLVSPDTVVLTTSVDALLMVVLGGAGTLVGGAIGSGIVFGLREYLSTLVPWWQYVLGGVYVLTILYLPTGLMGLGDRGGGLALIVLDDELDVGAAQLAAVLVEIHLEAVAHVLADLGKDAGHRRDEADTQFLGLGRRCHAQAEHEAAQEHGCQASQCACHFLPSLSLSISS